MSNRDDGPTFPAPDSPVTTALAVVIPLALFALAMYLLSRRSSDDVSDAASTAAKKGRSASRRARSTPRRLGLTLLINALENDVARRVLVAGLKIARNRM